jgi:FtsX extracellular domain
VTEQLPAPVPAPNRTRLFIVAGVVVLVLAGVVVWSVTWGSGGQATAQPVAVIPMPGHQVCADQVRLSVNTDAQMTQIADEVRNDPRVKVVYTETQQQAFERYKQEFADQPNLLALGRPGVLPASVLVVPVGGIDVHQLADTFRQKFADVKQVDPQNRADAIKALASIGETDTPPPCPASGEFPNH